MSSDYLAKMLALSAIQYAKSIGSKDLELDGFRCDLAQKALYFLSIAGSTNNDERTTSESLRNMADEILANVGDNSCSETARSSGQARRLPRGFLFVCHPRSITNGDSAKEISVHVTIDRSKGNDYSRCDCYEVYMSSVVRINVRTLSEALKVYGEEKFGHRSPISKTWMIEPRKYGPAKLVVDYEVNVVIFDREGGPKEQWVNEKCIVDLDVDPNWLDWLTWTNIALGIVGIGLLGLLRNAYRSVFRNRENRNVQTREN